MSNDVSSSSRLPFEAKIIIFAGLFIGVVFMYSMFTSGRYLTYGSDQYYYLSLADNLVTSGELLNTTSIQTEPPVTIQNGVPIVLAFFKKFIHANHVQSLILLSLLNYVFWLLSAFAYYKLIIKSRITGPYLHAILVAGFLSSGILLRAQTAPITDGIYNAIAIILIYLLIVRFTDKKTTMQAKEIFIQWLPIGILTMIGIHFSIRIMTIIVAALVTSLLLRHKNSMQNFFALIAVCVTGLLSLALSLRYIDTSLIHSFSQTFNQNIIHNLQTIGGSFLYLHISAWSQYIGYIIGTGIGFIFGIIVLIFLLYTTFLGIKKRDSILLFLSLSILCMASVILPLPSVEIAVEAGPRYIVLTLPLIWILLSRFKLLIAYLSIISSIIVSLVYITQSNSFSPVSVTSFYQYIISKNIHIPSEDILIIEYPRASEFLLHARHSNEIICDVPISNGTYIWIVGSKYFRIEQINRVSDCKSVNLQYIETLSDDYSDPLDQKIEKYIIE